jgi:hypothetical protein
VACMWFENNKLQYFVYWGDNHFEQVPDIPFAYGKKLLILSFIYSRLKINGFIFLHVSTCNWLLSWCEIGMQPQTQVPQLSYIIDYWWGYQFSLSSLYFYIAKQSYIIIQEDIPLRETTNTFSFIERRK